jgi:hypothetical protein
VPNYPRRDTWRRWVGAPDDLADLTETSTQAIAELGSSESASIKTTQTGVEDEFDAATFRTGLTASNAREIRRIFISAHAFMDMNTQGLITISLDKEGPWGVRLSVDGTNQRWVEGTFKQLSDMISSRSKRPRRVWPIFHVRRFGDRWPSAHADRGRVVGRPLGRTDCVDWLGCVSCGRRFLGDSLSELRPRCTRRAIPSRARLRSCATCVRHGIGARGGCSSLRARRTRDQRVTAFFLRRAGALRGILSALKEPTSSLPTLEGMPNAVVQCGRCGQPLGLLRDVDGSMTEQQLRSVVVEQLGERVKCERCNSILIGHTGTLTDGTQVARAVTAEKLRKKMRGGVRWSVGSATGARSTIWRVWAHRSDVYIAARTVASDMKVSLHASGRWRAAFTEHHLTRPKPLIPPGADRAIEKWTRPPEFAPGWTRAFLIIVPASEVVTSEAVIEDADEVLWFERPPDGWALHFDVLFAAPEAASAPDGRGFATAAGYEDTTEVVTVFNLANGDRLWVVVHAEPVSPEQAAKMEELRAHILERGGEAMRQAATDAQRPDFRGVGSGFLGDGARFYIELAVPQPR